MTSSAAAVRSILTIIKLPSPVLITEKDRSEWNEFNLSCYRTLPTSTYWLSCPGPDTVVHAMQHTPNGQRTDTERTPNGLRSLDLCYQRLWPGTRNINYNYNKRLPRLSWVERSEEERGEVERREEESMVESNSLGGWLWGKGVARQSVERQ